MELRSQRDLCTPIFTAALFTTAKTRKLSIHDTYTCKMEYYSAVKRNLSTVTAWIVLTLSDVSGTENMAWPHSHVGSKIQKPLNSQKQGGLVIAQVGWESMKMLKRYEPSTIRQMSSEGLMHSVVTVGNMHTAYLNVDKGVDLKSSHHTHTHTHTQNGNHVKWWSVN